MKKRAKKAVKKKTVKKTKKKATKAKKKPAQAKKAPVKKAKPRITVTITRKVLGKAPEQHHFHLEDGRRIESVYELVDELETMTEDTFRHYVSDLENHFANWVEHVFEDKTLAEEMRHVQDRVETQRALLKHLVRELTKEVHKKK